MKTGALITISMNSLFDGFDPIIVGSKLINSKFIDVVDVVEVECGRTLRPQKLTNYC